MFASAPLGESLKRTLADDDVAGLCTVYPLKTPLPECEPFDVSGDYFPGPGMPPATPDLDVYQNVGCDCSVGNSDAPSLPFWIFAGWILVSSRRRIESKRRL